MSRRATIQPNKVISHRTAVTNITGVDATPPSTTHADWDSSLRYPIIRIFAQIAFTGGTNPSIDIGAWVRHADNSGTPVYVVGRAPNPDNRWQTGTLRIIGSTKIAFDILTDTDDFLVLAEAVNGSPTAWTLTLNQSVR